MKYIRPVYIYAFLAFVGRTRSKKSFNKKLQSELYFQIFLNIGIPIAWASTGPWFSFNDLFYKSQSAKCYNNTRFTVITL